MELIKYEVGKEYPKPDGTKWIFLGYYLEMPVWKVEEKHQTETNVGEGGLPDRSSSKDFFRRKRTFVNYFKARAKFFFRSQRMTVLKGN